MIESEICIKKKDLEKLIANYMDNAIIRTKSPDLEMQLEALSEFHILNIIRRECQLNVHVPLTRKGFFDLEGKFAEFRHRYQVIERK